MSLRVLSLAAAAALLAVCSASSAAPPPADDVSHWDDAQKASFNATFARTTHDSCVSSAKAHGANAATAESYCACIVSKLEPLSVEDKMALPQHQDAMVAASNACKAT